VILIGLQTVDYFSMTVGYVVVPGLLGTLQFNVIFVLKLEARNLKRTYYAKFTFTWCLNLNLFCSVCKQPPYNDKYPHTFFNPHKL